jgi:hypothetical protein
VRCGRIGFDIDALAGRVRGNSNPVFHIVIRRGDID